MTQNGIKDLFWLHIKKSAGQSTRAALGAAYRTVDRSKKPKCFLQADPSEYNDILNNYRVPLGDYQFRRALFAKTFLYPDRWGDMVKFAFSREPVSRTISAFFMLYGGSSGVARKNRIKYLKRHHGWALSRSAAFDQFLDMIAEQRQSPSHFQPYGLHFATHTAAMWDDVTDDKGNILLDYIFRLEDFRSGINQVLTECGHSPRRDEDFLYANRASHKKFQPDSRQIRRIETLYVRDFEIYERQHYTKKV